MVKSKLRQNRSSQGFTLIEMLVSVTLVLLMMVMFGEVFQLATGSVSRQRVMADNDQNARNVVTVLRGDLDKRTVRTVVPFFPGELSTNPGTPFGSRRGYVSISCNNNADGTDDVLQFTTLVSINVRNSDESPYYGRAIPLFAGAGGTAALNFLANPNQPDRDDGQITSNNAASSKAAEVSYFMRGRRLYRRVMLLRDPIPSAGNDPSDPAQPKFVNPANGAGVDYFLPGGVYDTQSSNPPPLGAGSIGFWRDFDFSASRTPTSLLVYAPTLPINAKFHGLDALSNDKTSLPYTPHPYMASLGQTWNRFGYNHEIVLALPPGSPPLTANGMPREYTTATASAAIPSIFIGRFTQEETSHPNFRYPQATAIAPATPPGGWNGNPMDAIGTELTLNAFNGAVNEFQPNAAASRPGVDLLLSNVHEFRVEVWDQNLFDFAPVGHTRSLGGVAGDYHVSRQLNPTFGPLGGAASCFDTWHPDFNRSANFLPNGLLPPIPILGDVADRPPFRPLNYDPTGFSGRNPVATNPSGNGPYWAPNTSYQVGDVIFPLPGEDLNFNGFLDPGEDGINGFPSDGFLQEQVQVSPLYPVGVITDDVNGNGVLDMGEDGSFGFPADGAINVQNLNIPYSPTGTTFAYRCIRNGTSGPTRLDQPAWSSSIGRIIRQNEDTDNDGVLDPGEDTNLSGGLDLFPDWIVDYNVRPLRAIRITVRFEHPTSKQMKQITIVHSLRDTTSVP